MANKSLGLTVLDVADDPYSSATSYRVLCKDGRVVYISIDDGLYENDDYSFTPKLLSLLPHFPPGEWNRGRITRTQERPNPHFIGTTCAKLSKITSTWHQRFVEFHELNIGEKLMPNVAEAFHLDLGEVIAKYARFEWEIPPYQTETEVYHWLNYHNIGPQFLGHLTEGGRVIGFLLQKIDGHYAQIQDLARCEDAVRKLHSLDILHGDLNRYNFLIGKDRVVLIDFETSFKSRDKASKTEELQGLSENFLDDRQEAG
ncbi:MAG: hypothetical protein Q9182_006142 [Xanthomendoza sp. 2 TL-2023]